MKVLVFDTETTGLLPKIHKGENKLDYINEYPYIIQFSFILYDSDNHNIVENHDYIIKLPMNTKISKKSIELHGIDAEKSLNEGRDIIEILDIFDNVLSKSDVVIAHNYSFDETMVQIEYIRNEKKCNLDKSKNNIYCTMENSVDLCGLVATNRVGTYKKFPRQNELHMKLFHCIPENLHNSYNDILVCLRCYFKMQHDVDICNKNEEIKKLFIEKLNV